MPTPPLSEETLIETVNAYQANEANQRAASEALGISRSALQDRLRMAKARGMIHEAPAPEVPQAAPLPDPDLPIEQLVTYKKSAFERKHANVLAKRWRRFNVPTSGPYALMFVGDPHLDDDGCNLPLWEDHCELMAGTEHLYAVNIGDVTNDWVGRLAKLYANQEMGAHNAKRLVKHYLAERGIPWFLWLHGNHDMWDGPVGRDFFEGIRPNMSSWKIGRRRSQWLAPTAKKYVFGLPTTSRATAFGTRCTARFGRRRWKTGRICMWLATITTAGCSSTKTRIGALLQTGCGCAAINLSMNMPTFINLGSINTARVVLRSLTPTPMRSML